MIKKKIKFKKTKRMGLGVLIILFLLGLKLSYWQYSRAQEKKQLELLFQTQRIQAPILVKEFDLERLPQKFSNIKILGKYLPEFIFLLDNQMQDKKPGYLIFLLFQLKNTNQVILINHGWVSKNNIAYHKNLKNLKNLILILNQKDLRLSGLVAQPSSGLLLNSKYWSLNQSNTVDSSRKKNKNYQWAIQTLNFQKINDLLKSELIINQYWKNKTIIPIVLNPDPDFRPKFGLSAIQHYNYAIQWLLLSGLLLGYLIYFFWPRH
jgi:cytochrome oxidase assembly protein ShyY1